MDANLSQHKLHDIANMGMRAVIGVILTLSTVASLIKSKKDPTAHAHAGRVTAPKKTEHPK